MQKYASFRSGSFLTRLKIGVYYVQRVTTNKTVRRVANRALVSGLRTFHRSKGLYGPAASLQTEYLKKAGCAELGSLLSTEQCEDIRRYLADQYMVDARGSKARFKIDEVPHNATLGDYSLGTIVDCPHILDIANHPDLIDLMWGYLGFKPTIVSLGLRWSFPSDKATDVVQRFHRDSEPGSAKVLIYLTDVDDGSGPHAYVEGTHRDRIPLRLRPYEDNDVERQYGGSVVITGPAGTGIAIDTKGIHKGIPPSRRPRLLLGIQYALLPCFMYEYFPVKCSRARQFDPYINRLMITNGDEPERSNVKVGELDPLFDEYSPIREEL